MKVVSASKRAITLRDFITGCQHILEGDADNSAAVDNITDLSPIKSVLDEM